jgi:hypothetical protein
MKVQGALLWCRAGVLHLTIRAGVAIPGGGLWLQDAKGRHWAQVLQAVCGQQQQARAAMQEPTWVSQYALGCLGLVSDEAHVQQAHPRTQTSLHCTFGSSSNQCSLRVAGFIDV